jgi:HAD superfamily hydrolase (TIGR01549 family)
MAVTAVIFDVDGTLVDSVGLHARAWEEAFRHFGHEIPFEEIRRQIGKGSDKLIPHFLPPEEFRRIGEQLDKFRGELWKSKYLSQVKPFPKVRELFQKILADGKRIALASSAKGDELQTYKEIAGIDDLVETETSADDVESSKPDPDVIHAALRKLNNPDPAEGIMVGDTPYDAIAAAKAGVRTIGVLCGGFPERELREAGCIAIYRDPADLLAQYEESPLAGRVLRVA